MKQNIVIIFGGISAEHDVSIITGLQVIENIDKDKYNIYPIYQTRNGAIYILPNLSTRKLFKNSTKYNVTFSSDNKGGYIEYKELFINKIYIDSAYLSFHGGNGENGSWQGLFSTLNIPITSSDIDGSVICMNKILMKVSLQSQCIPTLPYISIFSNEIKSDIDLCINQINSKFTYPIILKPAHLGSSIGISVCNDEIELKVGLLSAIQLDDELLIEPFKENFYELNISVRSNKGQIECSKIEKPMKKDIILSFDDKYKGGSKKSGSGMASLKRDLPANISIDLSQKIIDLAKRTYEVCRCEGIVRIDFMIVEEEIYVTEINSIPGSVSYYLWEANAITFQDQITQSIEDSIYRKYQKNIKIIDHKSNIVDQFIYNAK